MIKLIETNQLPSVNFTDGFSVTKIRANLSAYGCGFSFLNSWYQQNEQGEITAIIQKMETNLLMVATPNADFKEIKDFILVIGFSSIGATPEILTRLGFKFKEYQVLEFKGKGKEELPPYPNIKEVYCLLYIEKNQSIRPTDFEGFYADLSHKIRKGIAAAITLDDAVCVASHITESTAVISGVVVQKRSQNCGLGSKLLNQMRGALGWRKIFVAAEEDVVTFYIKNGFSKAYKIAIYETEEN